MTSVIEKKPIMVLKDTGAVIETREPRENRVKWAVLGPKNSCAVE